MQELLRQLPADVDDDALCLALAPILARNPQEQALVYEKMDVCRRRADDMATVMPTPVSKEGVAAAKALRRWYWRMWLPLALAGLLVLGTAYWLWRIRAMENPAVILRQEIAVNTTQTAKLCPADFPKADSSDRIVRDLSIRFSTSILSKVQIEGEGAPNPDDATKTGASTFGTFRIQNDTCFFYTAKDSIGQDSIVLTMRYSDGKKAELQLRIFVAKPSTRPTGPEPPPNEQPTTKNEKPFPYPHDITRLAIEPPEPWVLAFAQWWPWLRWLLLGLLAAALVAAWQYWQQKRRKLIAELRSRDKPPYVWNIKIPGSDDIVLGDDFSHVLQVLRRRAGSDHWRLDLKATIAATAARGGMPEFRFQEQTRPVDYLLLIDRQSVYNHRAQLYDALYRAFRAQEIEIARFFFDADIRLCHNEEHPNGLRLAEIAQRFGDARLMVVGTGTQIISPMSGQVESWATIFQTWSESALLTPKPHNEWARNERRLAECFSVVLPASLQSLAFWVEETEAGEDARFDEWRERVQDAPAAFWQPDSEVPMPLLQLQYDDRMLRWIAACAIYPALHYDLTLWLGRQLHLTTLADLTTLSKLSNLPRLSNVHTAEQPIELNDLTSLFRLRWFVDGHIPQTARVALLDWLQAEDPALLSQLRLALADLLRQNPPPKDSAAYNDHALSVAVTEWLATKDAKRRKELEKQIARLLEAGAEADFVTLKYLDKPRGPLDFEVPKSWKKYVHPGGQRALGNRLPMFAAVFVALCCLGFLGNRWVSDWLDGQLNRCKGEAVVYARFDNLKKVVKSSTLCLDSPEDSLLWLERQMLDAIEDKAYPVEDNLYRLATSRLGYTLNAEGWVTEKKDPDMFDARDSLMKDIRQNLAVAYWNKAIQWVPGGENFVDAREDSACWLGTRAAIRYVDDPDIRQQYLLCSGGKADTLPKLRLLGPIAVTVVDATTGKPITNASITAVGMKSNAVRKQGAKLTLTPPADWANPAVTLLAKAPGYIDSIFYLPVDNVRAFPALGLRKAPESFGVLNGFIKDQENAQPIPGVLVKISGAGFLYTLSDQAGFFRLQLPFKGFVPGNEYEVVFQALEYKEFRLKYIAQTFPKNMDISLEKIPTTIPASDPVIIPAFTEIAAPPVDTVPPTILLPTMLPIPGGTFTMGSADDDKDASDNEKPAHQVRVADFELGKYEVTIEEYLAFCDETKSNYPEWLEPGSDYNVETGTSDYYKQKGMSRANKKHPITGVSWNNAVAYCDWLTKKTGQQYRLPSEAEWEYAARGGQAWKKDNFTYAGSNNIDEVAWYDKNSDSKTQPVGQKKPNQLGLYDMSGNVWEWCADWYSSDYYQKSPASNPAGPSSGSYRVLRGGSWYSHPQFCRVAVRSGNAPGNRGNYLGFRLARTK